MHYSYLLLTLMCLYACSPSSPSQADHKYTNFILIFADDLGYGDLGVYGHPTIHTPHLDKMAAEGMKFTQFYAAASVCTPSRAGLITGRLPIRSGMCSNTRRVLFPFSKRGIPQSEITLAEALTEQGYATGIVGKWHLGHLPEYLPRKHGFDYYFGIPYSNDMSMAQGAGYVCPPLPLIENDSLIEEEPDQGTLTRRYTEKILSFIDDHTEEPFFLYYPQTFPHIPLYANPPFADTSARGLYGDVVEEMDWSVGQILAKLREKGLDKNTLVVFTSDNGPWVVMNERGGSAGLLRGGKGATWEGGMRAPMIAWMPEKIPAGVTQKALSSTLDLFPTFLSIAGGRLAQDRPYDGIDLSPVLWGERDEAHTELPYYFGRTVYAYRKGPWKAHFTTYTAYIGAKPERHDPPLLFNLEHDPAERFNKAAEHPEILEEIQQAALAHKAGVDSVESVLEDINEIQRVQKP